MPCYSSAIYEEVTIQVIKLEFQIVYENNSMLSANFTLIFIARQQILYRAKYKQLITGTKGEGEFYGHSHC